MSDPLFQHFTTDFSKPQDFDFYSFHTNPDAPHPDLFDSELDCSLAALGEDQLQLFTVENTDAFTLLRTDNPVCGPPSTITVSTESAYESISSNSDYWPTNFPVSPYQPSNYSASASNYSFGALDMDFQGIHVDGEPEFTTLDVTQGSESRNKTAMDTNCFANLLSNPNSPLLAQSLTRKAGNHLKSRSEYTPARSPSADFLSALTFDPSVLEAGLDSPSATPSPPKVPSVPQISRREEDDSGDPRRKYHCTQCPRSFARAYNLKTHMATHDPNRPKPHVCPHRSCGRSFSRKHDLGRHLFSIHRDNSSSHHTAKIGVEKGPRGWCETCGKGWIGRNNDCDCNDVK